MSKKAQLTIFIIVGIVVLLSAGVVVYLEQQKVAVPVEEEVVVPTIAEVPTEVAPISDFITSCVSQVGETGLKLLGERGGYINPDAAGLKFNPTEPTESEVVELAPRSGLKIPYWWHLSSKNDCTGSCNLRSEAPPLYRNTATQFVGSQYAIEKQLDDYVAANLRYCLAEFSQFKAQGFEFEETGALKVGTTVAAKTVNFYVEWPIVARKAGQEFQMNEYFTQANVALKDIYELGTGLVNVEMETTFLEHNLRNLIDVYGQLDSDFIMPVSDTQIGFGKRVIWLKYKVKERIMQAVASNIQLLRMAEPGAVIEAPADVDKNTFDVFYNRGMLVSSFADIDSPQYFPNLKTTFDYYGWEPYFDSGGCRGEVCEGESANMFDFLLGINEYAFAYDISFPVLVRVFDPDAFNGNGYEFQFFLEENMRSNEPLKPGFVPLTTAAAAGPSMFCSQEQATPYNVTVIATDRRTGKPVDGATVFFACGDASCAVGQTDASGTFVGRFPTCFDGVVSVLTEDSFPAYARLTTLYDKPATTPVSVTVEPYKYVNFALKKHVLSKTPDYYSFVSPITNAPVTHQSGWSWKFASEKADAKDLVSGEYAMIMLTRKAAPGEDEFTVVAEVNPDAAPNIDSAKDIRLIPGEYTIRIDFFKTPDKKIIIPPQANYKKNEEWCIPGDKIVFEPDKEMYVGAAEFDWKLEPQNLDKANTITFYAPFLDFESVTDRCYVTRDNRDDADKSWAPGEGPVVTEADNWVCGRGKTRTACERTIDDLDMMEQFQDYVESNSDAFTPLT